MALARDVVEESRLARAPSGIEGPGQQLQRLIDAHEFLLNDARPLAREAATDGDDGSNDLIVSQVIRGNEMQGWYVHRQVAGLRPG